MILLPGSSVVADDNGEARKHDVWMQPAPYSCAIKPDLGAVKEIKP